jgi:hypothetical protein
MDSSSALGDALGDVNHSNMFDDERDTRGGGTYDKEH